MLVTLRGIPRLCAAVAIVTTMVVSGATSASSSRQATTLRATCDTNEVLRDRDAVDRIEAQAQASFLQELNAMRRGKGLSSLAWNARITGPSIDWSQTMSTQVPPGGSSSRPGWLHHARDKGPDDGVTASQDYVNINSRIVANWKRLAENVGVGGMRSSCTIGELETNTERVVDALHRAFVASEGHYKNMVGAFNQVGIGVHIDDNELWVTVRFAMGDLPENATTTVTPEVGQYIDSVHVVFVSRKSTEDEKQRWAPAVSAGDRKALTSALAVTDSFAGKRVNEMYRVVLGRDADSAGRRYWVGQIAAGLQIEAAAVEFYGSPEYYDRSGGRLDGFVRSIYDDLLGRSADAAGIDYWSGLVRRGDLTRSGVADNLYRSIESRRDRVERLYDEILGAAPTDNARDQWADRLTYVGDLNLAAELAATSAFWNQSVR